MIYIKDFFIQHTHFFYYYLFTINLNYDSIKQNNYNNVQISYIIKSLN
jgi:hypothetical protein